MTAMIATPLTTTTLVACDTQSCKLWKKEGHLDNLKNHELN